jgi:hypothetical protein
MGGQNQDRTLLQPISNGGDGSADPQVVFHLPGFDGNIEVGAHKNAPPLKVEIADSQFIHGSTPQVIRDSRFEIQYSQSQSRISNLEFQISTLPSRKKLAG